MDLVSSYHSESSDSDEEDSSIPGSSESLVPPERSLAHHAPGGFQHASASNAHTAGRAYASSALNASGGSSGTASVSTRHTAGRRLRPCRALLDDEEHPEEPEKKRRLDDEIGGCEVQSMLQQQSCALGESVTAAAVGEDQGTSIVVDGASARISRVLSSPPIQIASLLSVPGGRRPACKPPRRIVHTFRGHTSSVLKLAWHEPGGQLLLSCGMDGLMCLWEPWIKRQCVKKLSPHGSSAICCGLWYDSGSSAGGGESVERSSSSGGPLHFLSGGYDRHLRLLDIENDRCVLGLRHDHCVTTVARHPTRRSLVLTGTSQHTIAAWDLRCGKKVRDCTPAVGQVQDILFLPDNERFVVACDTRRRSDADRSLGVWDFDSGVRLVDQIYPEPYSCTRLALDKATKNFLAQSNSGHTAIFKASAPYKLNKFKRYDKHQVSGYPMGLCVSRDGQFLYSPSSTGHLYCYNYHSSKVVKSWSIGEPNILTNVVHHPLLPSALATSSWDGDVQLWM